MKRKRLFLLSPLIAVGLFGTNLYAYWTLAQSRDDAALAQTDAERCLNLSNQIIALRTKPAIAGTREEAQEELTGRIEAAARDFGITGDNLASITPEPAQRLADTVYLEKPTTIQLRQITLVQLVGLLCRLSGDGTGLRVKALRLTAPPQSNNSDLWSVEATIAYLIYSPQAPASNKGDI